MAQTPACFIIAEAGVNHNGSPELALQLVDVAAAAGADAVKFQTFRAETLVRAGAEKAEYQKRQTGEGDQFSMLKALELSEEAHRRVAERCREKGIRFMSTPFDLQAADFLLELGMDIIKIPSGELTNHPFLAELAKRNRPLILSTGMGDLDEIREAVAVIRDARRQSGLGGLPPGFLTVLHCTSNYPAQPQDVNLLAMRTIAAELGVEVGYSDHTAGITVAIAAVALGARVIEKHFTLDRTLPGPDHAASLEPQELAAMVRAIRDVGLALGDGVKTPRPSELPVRALVRRSLTLGRDVAAGATVTAEDLVLLRPGTGIAPKHLNEVIGQRRYARDLSAGATLEWTDLA
ncbi:MAG TPA: N-acetylneuraminate synthase [Fluviicoccus sp.]|nr:N-acetylneuraminate synthase [Fluviicoccus sp.]